MRTLKTHALLLFSLVDQRGEEVILGAPQQRTSLLFFGYTYCPDFCPTTLSRLVHVKQRLGADADSIDIAFGAGVQPVRPHRSTTRRCSQPMNTV